MNYELINSPSPELVKELTSNFFAYSKSKLPNLPPESEDKIFMVSARSQSGELIGGILANCYWDGLEIDTVWVSGKERGNGLGSELVSKAEAFGISNGAVIAFLKTMDAKAFYTKLGYEVYGALEDRPIGTLLYHMKKRLNK
ncbi:GNAT family acetyltransferase [Oleiphilus sp. HI0125]|uniref:GNAT family N-acetyltransferase n=2 Tax=Oleiphilus sp. HI0125 TaxID=1822266 RepID=UPI0007C2B98B|nr:GNAT family N-acetyltransferase [Oleiphilus sp. HI0125]KZZ62872.1 GNAT family acetyltransferase [Oleiphilus sp. HI0125]